ncbi:hypothetical protein MMPV_009541 [Pyropia vietnamensis]
MLRTSLARAAVVRSGVMGVLRQGAPPAGVAGSLPLLTRASPSLCSFTASTCCGASSLATPSSQASADVVVAPPSSTPNHRSLLALDENTIVPFVQPNAYVAPSASVIGSVVINDQSAVMNGAVVRGDLAFLRIGAFTMVGDNCVLSAEGPSGEGAGSTKGLSASDAVATDLPMEPSLFVGDYVDVAPNCVLNGCTLEGENAVGANTVIEPGAIIGRQSLVEPGSVVAAGTVVPGGEAWGGVPAVKLRDLDGDEKEAFVKNSMDNVKMAARYASEFLPVGTVYWEAERASA